MSFFETPTGKSVEINIEPARGGAPNSVELSGSGVPYIKEALQKQFLEVLQHVAHFTEDECNIAKAYLPYDEKTHSFPDLHRKLLAAGINDLAKKLEPFCE